MTRYRGPQRYVTWMVVALTATTAHAQNWNGAVTTQHSGQTAHQQGNVKLSDLGGSSQGVSPAQYAVPVQEVYAAPRALPTFSPVQQISRNPYHAVPQHGYHPMPQSHYGYPQQYAQPAQQYVPVPQPRYVPMPQHYLNNPQPLAAPSIAQEPRKLPEQSNDPSSSEEPAPLEISADLDEPESIEAAKPMMIVADEIDTISSPQFDPDQKPTEIDHLAGPKASRPVDPKRAAPLILSDIDIEQSIPQEPTVKAVKAVKATKTETATTDSNCIARRTKCIAKRNSAAIQTASKEATITKADATKTAEGDLEIKQTALINISKKKRGCDSNCDSNSCKKACDLDGTCDDNCCGNGKEKCHIFKRLITLDFARNDQPLLHCLQDKQFEFLGDCWHYSVGGHFRYRYMDEENRIGRPPGVRETYHLWRTVGELTVGNDWLTLYGQGIDAHIQEEELGLTPIDENRADMLQFYADAEILDIDGKTLSVRVGRQTLKYGAERFISPLAWANTFRNFEGARVMFRSCNWDIDAFAVQPVNGAARGIVYRPESYDQPDQSVVFAGAYATRRNTFHGDLDVYYLHFNEDVPTANRHNGRRHTVGGRWYGEKAKCNCDVVKHTLLWDVEGGIQWGEDDFGALANGDVLAWYGTGMIGIRFDCVKTRPELRAVAWYGSGDRDATDGEINTVSTLYPLGHAHWGLIDNFNGSNLIDISAQGIIHPFKKFSVLTAWHWFNKAETSDVIYNIGGAPFGVPGESREIGHELDVVGTYTFNKNFNVSVGYLWFWYGDAVTASADGRLPRPDAHELYIQSILRF